MAGTSIRSSGYGSLTILLTEHENTQFADIIGSGGGDGILNIGPGANTNFAGRAAKILSAYGFAQE